MFKSKQILKIVVIIAMVSTFNLILGCNSSPTDNNPNQKLNDINQSISKNSDKNIPTDKYVLRTDIERECLLKKAQEKDFILSTVLSNDNVNTAKTWLENQGYEYVDSNSLVLVQNEFNYVSDTLMLLPNNNKMVFKSTPQHEIKKILIEADSISWMAFENPTHDLSNHTALITFWRNDGKKNTVMIELNVGTNPPGVIREGVFIDGTFVPEDIGTVDFLGCLLGGIAASAVGCILSNCGYGACLGVGSAASLVGCTVQWLLD